MSLFELKFDAEVLCVYNASAITDLDPFIKLCHVPRLLMAVV